MKYATICSGIEAPTVAWAHLNWTPIFFSELDRCCSLILDYHYPDIPNYGDFTTIENCEPFDLLAAGTPCQAFSVAGLRLGLDDSRGNLTLEWLRIVRWMRPRWILWENVPGVLSIDRGRVFGAILGALGKFGYGWAYRVLDAQYWGVPQRRRRVFLIGYLGDPRPAQAVLFEPGSVQGDSTQSEEAGEGTPRRSGQGAYSSGQEDLIAVDYTNCLLGSVSGTIDASMDKGNRGQGVLVYDPTQITSPGNYSNPRPGDPCHPLAQSARPPMIAFTSKDHGQDAGLLSPTLRSMGHRSSHANSGGQIAIAFAERARPGGRNLETQVELAYALANPGSGGRTHSRQLLDPSRRVRRLTPLECERLQGLPDNYTRYFRSQGGDYAFSDAPRYKVIGNSIAVPVLRWIGERIALVEAILQ